MNSWRPFRRDRHGITLFLRLEDWPDDVPLPEGTRVMEIGDGAFWPNWQIVLEPDRTIEEMAGWFIVPHLSTEETFEWYQTEMAKRGWEEVERVHTLPSWALLRYRHPEKEVYVEISIGRNRYLNRTQPMIRRVAVHPYVPLEEEEAGEPEPETVGV